nr:MAG TPA: hypothetical protein [Caudoviricetes sp.]
MYKQGEIKGVIKPKSNTLIFYEKMEELTHEH